MIVFVFVFVVDPALLGLCFVGVFFVHGDGVVPELMLLRPPRRPRPVRRLPLVAMVARHHADAASSLGEDWRV